MKQRIFVIFNGRFPSEKAAALFAAKGCEAFAEIGLDVVLLVPRRRKNIVDDPYDYFSVKKNFKIVYIPTIDLYRIHFLTHFAFLINSFFFSLFTFLYLFFKAYTHDIVYSNENFSLYIASFRFKNVFYEMHDFPEKSMMFYRGFLARMRGVIIHNKWKTEEAQNVLRVPSQKILYEPNAVEIEKFNLGLSKEDARQRLGVLIKGEIVVYTGHLYGWKGTDTLAEAAKLLPADVFVYFIGGTTFHVEKFRREYGNISNIKIIGHRNHAEIPLWQQAADVLVLPNTAKEKISKYYTSPMKLFEYMASRRPIVASNIPSIVEILSDETGYIIEPDNPKQLALVLSQVLAFDNDSVIKASNALGFVREHTWLKRAFRIISFINYRICVK